MADHEHPRALQNWKCQDPVPRPYWFNPYQSHLGSYPLPIYFCIQLVSYEYQIFPYCLTDLRTVTLTVLIRLSLLFASCGGRDSVLAYPCMYILCYIYLPDAFIQSDINFEKVASVCTWRWRALVKDPMVNPHWWPWAQNQRPSDSIYGVLSHWASQQPQKVKTISGLKGTSYCQTHLF